MILTNSYIYWLILCSLTLGILSTFYFDIFLGSSILYIFCILGVLILLFSISLKNGILLVIGICILFFSLGSLRTENNFIENNLIEFNGKNIEVEGIIIDDPKIKDTSLQYRILVEDLQEYILIIDYSLDKRMYGDFISVNGKLLEPKAFITDTGRIFNYKNFLLKDKVRFFIKTENIKHIKQGEGNIVKHFLIKVKTKFIGIINKTIPNPESSLLLGLLLGVQSSLGSNLLEIFRASGLIHIIVLSGYNITLIIEVVRRMTNFLSRNTQITLCMLFILMFVIMVGPDIPVIRSSMMAIVSLIALHFHREYVALRALGLIFVLLILWNPLSLFYDPSLHLSVLATAGIILLTSKLEKYFSSLGLGDKFGLRGILAATLGTQIFVIPYLAFAIGEVSIVSLFANITAIPFVPFAMLFGFLTAILGFIFLPFAYILGTFTYFLLNIIIGIATFFGSLEFATVLVPEISISLLIIFYAFLFYFFGKTAR